MKLNLRLKENSFNGQAKAKTFGPLRNMEEMMWDRGFETDDPQVLFDAIDRACNITHEHFRIDPGWERNWLNCLDEFDLEFQQMLDRFDLEHDEHRMELDLIQEWAVA